MPGIGSLVRATSITPRVIEGKYMELAYIWHQVRAQLYGFTPLSFSQFKRTWTRASNGICKL